MKPRTVLLLLLLPWIVAAIGAGWVYRLHKKGQVQSC
jgi:hypothetical protein